MLYRVPFKCTPEEGAFKGTIKEGSFKGSSFLSGLRVFGGV